MDTQTVIVIAGVVIVMLALMVMRQLRWQIVTTSRLVLRPIVLATAGAALLATTLGDVTVQLGDVVALAVQALLAIGAGIAIGALTELRPQEVAVLARLRPLGVVVWFALVALRVGETLLARGTGLELAGNTAFFLFVLAIVYAVQAAIVLRRMSGAEHASASATVDGEPAVRS